MRRTVGLSLVGFLVLWAMWPAGAPPAEESAPAPTSSGVAPSVAPVWRVSEEVVAQRDEHVPSASASSAYVAGQMFVRLQPEAHIDELVAELGVELVREPGPSGWVALSLPQGSAQAAALVDHPAVASVQPMGRVRGADDDDDELEDVRSSDLQAHHPLIHVDYPEEYESGYRRVIVAVLDTGVAARADGLRGVKIEDPWNFVDGTDQADDDHQHGTHIASIILSKGRHPGISPTATLMPVKVLDERNEGIEADLVDGIHHAVDHGADIINLSLSFELGYVPSPALLEALQRAADAGIVMVGAAGNDGVFGVTWPAAHPDVMAVSSICFDGSPAPYSNHHPSVVVSAPGGCLDRDDDGDGYHDGVLADAIDLNDSGRTGFWFMAGTSQAAAMVTGAAVRAVYRGADADYLRDVLQYEANGLSNLEIEDGFGAGSLRVKETEDKASDDDVPASGTYFVSMLPWLTADGEPAVRVAVLDPSGEPASGVDVHVSFAGSSSSRASCFSIGEGICDAFGAAVDGSDESAAWTVSVDAIVDSGQAAPMQSVLFATDGLEMLMAALAAEADLAEAPLGIVWPEGRDEELGPMAESIVVVDGTGLASLPLGVIARPGALTKQGAVETLRDVDLDGTGLASIPLGLAKLKVFDLGGVGLASIPLGLRRMVTIDGTGLASIPLGLRARDIYLPGGDTAQGLSGLDAQPVSLVLGEGIGVDLAGTALEARLAEGGFTFSGYGAASLLGASMRDEGEAQAAPFELASLGSQPLE